MSIADRMSELAGGGRRITEKPKPKGEEPGGEKESASHTTLHEHGDGTYHTEGHDGERTEHPHIGHALMHMAAKHSEGKHMHVHEGEDGEHTTHHVGEDGKVEGPHDHENIEAVKEHLGKFFDEEEHEGKHGEYGDGHESLFGGE